MQRASLGARAIPLTVVCSHAHALLFFCTLTQDINEPLNSVEAFVAKTVSDLLLPQPMEPAIALAMHEQIANYRQVLAGALGPGLLNRIVESPEAPGSRLVKTEVRGGAC